MKPYTPFTNKGRSVALGDIHHRNSCSRSFSRSKAKSMRHAARQEGRAMCAANLWDAQEDLYDDQRHLDCLWAEQEYWDHYSESMLEELDYEDEGDAEDFSEARCSLDPYDYLPFLDDAAWDALYGRL